MSEAIWIELIKVLPAFLWIGFGFIALAVAKRLLTQQAPRMTRVETPWVTVELAQQAIEQAAVRGPARPVPVPEPDWSALFAAPPRQVPVGAAPVPSPPYEEPAEEADEAEPFPTQPPPETEPKPLATPPADGPADPALAGGVKQRDDEPPAPVTEPRPLAQTYPTNAPGGYYPPPSKRRTRHAASVPLPPYAMPSAYQRPPSADTRRGLRAATRLALSADLLQGGAILWVDDHHEWNEPLVRLFRTAGITVDTAASTEEALRALEDRSYDLVVTDMRREGEPDGDTAGIRLLDRMIAAGVPTPAVFFSDHPDAHANPHPRAVTATNSPEQLVDTVVDIVGTRRSLQAQAGSTWLDHLRGGR